jgi:UTP--glucose-1-phosphate uridylyltransferase
MIIRKAIIPIAGKGTRLAPITDYIPKAMLPIIDQPVLKHIIEETINAGITDIIFIISPKQYLLKSYLKNIRNTYKKIKIQLVYQRKPMGLGHAIYCAKSKINNEDFIVLLGDDLFFKSNNVTKQLIDAYNQKQSSIIGIQKIPIKDVNKYGIVAATGFDKKVIKLDDVIEKPEKNAPSNYGIVGRYLFTKSIFDFLRLKVIGINGEIQLTDAIQKLLKKEQVYGYIIEGKRLDAGNRVGLLEANIEYGLIDNQLKKDIIDIIKSIKVE